VIRVIVRRRRDGIVQIQRGSRLRAVVSSVPGAVVSWLLLFLVAVTSLAAALVLFPRATAVAGISGTVALAVARHGARPAA
jgi:hypothetical protein